MIALLAKEAPVAISLIPLIAEYLGKNARLKNLEEEPYSANEQRVANNPSHPQNNFINSYQLLNSNYLQPFYAGYQPSTTSSQDLNNNPTAPSTESELISSNSISISTPTDLALDAQMMILGMPDDGSAPLVESQSSKLPTEYLVQFNAGVSLDDRNTALARLNATISEIVHPADSNSGDLVLVRVPPGASPDVLSALGNAPGVKFAEPNWSIGVQAFSNDTYYSNGSLWGMYGDTTSPSNTYGSQAGEAWATGFTGTSKTVVGVIDTGIDYTHPDLYLNIWLNQGELPTGMALRDVDSDGLITFRDLNNSINSSFVSDLNNNGRIDAGDILNDARWENGSDQDSNGFIDDLVGWDFVNRDNDPYDDQSHGTHVAGTIGAMGGNGTGVAGVNWNVQMMGLKFLSATGSGSTAGAIQAIDYYTRASAIDQSSGWSSEFIGTNNSWGGGGFSQSLLDSIIRGAYQDALFIAAAGNRRTNNDSVANYPSNYSTLAAVGFESVIAVAATTNSGGLASYSNFGASTVDLGAPGSSIWSTVPGGGYASYSGTSMATPHVTGALALYASQNLSATSAQLRSQLLSNTTTLPSLAGKTVTGGTLDVGKMMSGGTPPTDTIAPLLSSATPADNSNNVAVGANLVMTFNETVRAGSGNIQIFNSNGTIARTIAVTDTSQVTFSGNTVTINPTADLARGAGYYVNMASGVIRDTAGNNFAGISNTTAWNFTTIVGDTSAPLLSSATPADNSTNVAVGANLVMTFNETVRAGSGNIQIFNSNGTIARTIAVTDTSQVTFSGNTVTINPTADLARGAGYYVNMASGVIRDTAGNNFAGISNSTAWNFMTAAPQDYAGNTLTTAYNIGALTGSRTFSDFVGTNDTNDYYRFTLNSRSNFSLSLSGMSADADVHILNASGSVIASSTAASANNESISKTLDAGNYYVRVYQYSGDTNYTLTLNQQNVAAPANGLALYGTDSSDVIVGTSFADLLSGAPIAGGLMGRGSIDRLTGGLGNDLFILGDARGRFYDDQNLSNAGMGDYALITDFQVSGDRLQLSSGNYFLAATTINGASGTGIYFDSNSNRSFGTNDELLGVLQGVSASALSSNNFTWI